VQRRIGFILRNDHHSGKNSMHPRKHRYLLVEGRAKSDADTGVMIVSRSMVYSWKPWIQETERIEGVEGGK